MEQKIAGHVGDHVTCKQHVQYTYQMTCNMCHMTCSMCHMTCNMYHMTCNMCHMTCNMSCDAQ